MDQLFYRLLYYCYWTERTVRKSDSMFKGVRVRISIEKKYI